MLVRCKPVKKDVIRFSYQLVSRTLVVHVHKVPHVQCPADFLQDLEMPAALKEADSTREAQLLESWKAYKKGFQEGISIFNQKPKKGIAFMQVRCYLCAQSTQLLSCTLC